MRSASLGSRIAVDFHAIANPCVVLHHLLPDGTEHYDWLMDRGDGGLLVAFRCDACPGDAAAFLAERSSDHRRLYLEYEGAVSGNRGHVRRVAGGACLIRVDAPGAFVVDVAFADGPVQRWSARPVEGGGAGTQSWRFLSARLGWRDDETRDIL